MTGLFKVVFPAEGGREREGGEFDTPSYFKRNYRYITSIITNIDNNIYWFDC